MIDFEEQAILYAAQIATDMGWKVVYSDEFNALEITSSDYDVIAEITGGGTPMLHMLRDDGADILEPLGNHFETAKPIIESAIKMNLVHKDYHPEFKVDPVTKQGDPREWGLNTSKDYSQYHQGGT